MKPIKTKIEVIIENIKVDFCYYSFDYTIIINKKKDKKRNYDSNYEGWTKKAWRKSLKTGTAVQIALNHINL